MLDTMRSFSSSFVSKLLMIFLVITFGVWGVGDILRSTGANYAAEVGDQKVTLSEFALHKAQIARQMESMGVKAPMSALEINVLRQLIQQKLITLGVRDLGLYVNDTLLTRNLRGQPMFQDKDGRFSGQAFRAVAQSQRVSEQTLLQQVKDDAASQFMAASLDMSDVVPPASVRSIIAATESETRDAWILTIPQASITSDVTEEELKDFYEKNKSLLYVQPESRTLEYVTLSQAQVTALIDASITPEMLEGAAKAQPKLTRETIREQFRTEQREQVMHDLQAALDDALAGGATLAQAAEKAGIKSGVRRMENINQTLAKTSNDDITKTVTEQGFAMGDGETSGIVFTPRGTPVIVHVSAIQASTPLPYDKVESDVRGHVAAQERREATRLRVQQVKEALKNLASADEKSEEKRVPTEQEYQAVFRANQISARRVSNLARPNPIAKTEVYGVPASLHQSIFEREIGSVAGPLALENGSQQLAIITASHHPEIKDTPEKTGYAQKKEFRELAAALNQTIESAALTALAKRHTVKVNQKALTPPEAEPTTETGEVPQ